MAEWIHDRHGMAKVILDSDSIRSSSGHVIAWLSQNSVFTLHGHHRGWFEDGVLFDSFNRVIGFTRNATGHLSSRPGLAGTPGMPGFSGRPGRPGFSGTPGRPGYGGWSSEELENYFK